MAKTPRTNQIFNIIYMIISNKVSLPKTSLTIKLIIIFTIVLVFGNYLPQEFKAGCYALSLSIKATLQFILPFILFSCLFSCIIEQQGKAIGFITLLFLIVSFSNMISILIGYFSGRVGLTYIHVALQQASEEINVLHPLWIFELNNPIKNGVAVCLAIIAGIFFSIYSTEKAAIFSQKINRTVYFFLEKMFIPTLPLFSLGFIIKMQYEGTLSMLIETYLPIMCLILLTTSLYLIVIFLMAANFNFKKMLIYIKNSLTASMIGFSTLSSLAAVPMILEATKRNVNNLDIAKVVIPVTINSHMIGSSIMIPIIAMYILLAYGLPLPSFEKYLIFAQFFVLAKFTVAAIPGGSIMVMLPLLESYLDFTAGMSSIVTTIYLLFNPFVSSANVLGNSALAILLTKFFSKPLEN